MSQKSGLRLIFLIGVPVALGAVLGANQLRAGAYLPWGLSVAYWIALVFVTWSAFALSTRIMARLFEPWGAQPWLAWLAGGIIGSFAVRPAIYLTAEAFAPFMSDGKLRTMPPFELSANFAYYYLTNWFAVIALWLIANWLFSWLQNHLEHDEKSSFKDGTSPLPDQINISPNLQARLDEFLSKVPGASGRDILALQSEDHYVRVHTAGGSTLLLSAISDAAEELSVGGIAGQRVHRSWWVSLGAVVEWRSEGRRLSLILSNGLEVPVSQTYRELARQAGLLDSRRQRIPSALSASAISAE